MSEKIDLLNDLELLEDIKKLDSFMMISEGYKSNIYSFAKQNKLSVSQCLNLIFDSFFNSFRDIVKEGEK